MSHQGDFATLTLANDAIAALAGGVVQPGLLWKCRIDGHEYQALEGESVFTSVIEPWDINPTGQMVPTTDGQGIGDVTRQINHVAFGDTTIGESEGIIGRRTSGGIAVIGVRAYDPANPDTAQAAPVDIIGSVVALSAESGFLLEVNQPLTSDHYLTISPSFVAPDGRLFCSMQVGPEVTFTSEQTVTDTRDITLNEGGPLISVVSLTTDVEYAPGSSIQVSLLLEEQGGRTAFIDVVYEVGGIEIQRDTVSVNGQTLDYGLNLLTTSTVASGVLVDILAEFTQTHNASDAHVRGDIKTSTLSMRAVAGAAQQAKFFVRLANANYGDTLPEFVPFGPIAQFINLEWKDVKPSTHFSEPGFKNIPLEAFGMDVTPDVIQQLITAGFDVQPMSSWPGP